jgi:spermidine synthase
MKFAWFLSATVGFLSLSQELLWIRLGTFVFQSKPQVFSYVLVNFLFGIAVGALVGKRICASGALLYPVAGSILIAAGLLDALGPFAIGFMREDSPVLLALALATFVCAAMKGIIFPIVHHLGSVPMADRIGGSVSRVYFFNIVGSTLGPLVTGYVLLDCLSLQAVMLVMAALTVAMGILCAIQGRSRARILAGGVGLAFCAAGFALPEVLVAAMAKVPSQYMGRVVENKSGIVHVVVLPELGDEIRGGNVYDGRATIDTRKNANGLHRVYALAALKPEVRDILVIGLSGGAWTRVLSAFPGVNAIDAVEINPGYLEVIADYPDIRPILSDPRIRIDIDDGRRWLRRRPERQYDLIVMNTTFFWRSHTTNLLSHEFFTQLKGHLRPGGVLSYNTTGSPDAFKTATTVFPFAYRYANFVFASDQDFRKRLEGSEATFHAMRMGGRPIFDPSSPEDTKFIAKMLAIPFVSIEEDEARIGRKGEVVTDWNMITEYRHGASWP